MKSGSSQFYTGLKVKFGGRTLLEQLKHAASETTIKGLIEELKDGLFDHQTSLKT
jgi:hypothetical protein